MPKDDPGQVFDVSKPHKVPPSPTSKPVIVGHQPMMSDPMVKDDNSPEPATMEHKAIPISTPEDLGGTPDDGPPPPEPIAQTAKEVTPPPDFQVPDQMPPPPPTPPAEQPQPRPDSFVPPNETPPQPEPSIAVPALAPDHPESVKAAGSPLAEQAAQTAPPGDLHLTPVGDLIGHNHHSHADSHHSHEAAPDRPAPPIHHSKKSGSKKFLWILLGLVLLIGAYLAVDAATNVNLPYQFFKTSAPAPTNQVTVTKTTITTTPAGYKAYNLDTTGISFKYPSTWGTPTMTKDPGYSTRSTSAQSDGNHAYIVDFSSNKDIELAFTSQELLPVSRTPTYYDFLQWCNGVGSNSKSFFKSRLAFTTSNGVDTPTTVVCDQGPLTTAQSDTTTAISATIVENNTPDAGSSLYTSNLKIPSITVLHVKDVTSKNATAINKLIASIQYNKQ